MPEQCRKCVPRIEKEHQALAKAEQSATAAATAATIPESAQADSVAQQHTGAELEEIWMGKGWKGMEGEQLDWTLKDIESMKQHVTIRNNHLDSDKAPRHFGGLKKTAISRPCQ